MRKLIVAMMVAGATLVAAPALAADFPEYPPIIEIPDVDYGVEGSFYLRGSVAGNLLWTKETNDYCFIGPCGVVPVQVTHPLVAVGYGYSVGAGIGYETGTGLRFDATVDYLANDGLKVTKADGDYTLKLRSTLALANAYYDFSFGNGGYGAAGGAFGYVGAGVGAAFNHVVINPPAGIVVPSGHNTSFAAAGMVGVGYDFGSVVADVGYRGVYIAQLSNSAAAPETVWSDNNWLHEVRGTLRYRFN